MRNITRSILTDPWFSSLKPIERLAWIGLLLTSDDQGRTVANPALIRSSIFPADDMTLAEVRDILDTFSDAGKYLVYEINGVKYGQMLNWWKYQASSEWMAKSAHPAPEGWTDCWRYHLKAGKVDCSNNWPDRLAGFLPSTLPSTLPSGQGSADVKAEAEADVKAEADGEADSSSDNPAAALDLLTAAGIGNPTRAKLAGMKHVTPDYLREIIAEWQERDASVGLLVKMIESNQRPKIKEKPVLRGKAVSDAVAALMAGGR